ncbi:MAG TPA: DNA repair protein RecN [Geminicoccaceae bacterium]|nr:DNA repair protein RecN [Geminicoccaceae bacterium]
MLTSLTIRDVVLIERLDLTFAPGLCVLTGETGAGKSILLDALGLALGGRADRDLVRRGASQASVSAVFAPAAGEPVEALLAEHGIAAEDDLVLRRVVGADGRSRGFVNDQPVGTGLMRQIGALLIEVHGQHEQQGLFEPAVQRSLLDAYGGLEGTVAELRAAHGRWRELERQRAELAGQLERAAAEEEYLRHVLAELEALAPGPDEEESLATLRARLMDREKLTGAIGEALALLRDGGGVEGRLGGAQRLIERVCERAGGALDAAVAALDRARVELAEADAALERAGHELAHGDERLEQIEERLFALRAAARKHRVAVADLPRLRDATAASLAAIDAGGERLAEAAKAAAGAREALEQHCRRLSAARGRAAVALGKAVMAELPPLKLDKARFAVRLMPLPEADWSADGAERVAFEVATNPGQEPGAIAKIASGGELARLMLAIKVVLARVGSVPTLVFDEVDTGIGGATAAAVGERLARLGGTVQVLAVTHAPQIAARAEHHWRVEKAAQGGRAVVTAVPLAPESRREEIARMLAGARITDAARAAADSLLARSA